MNRPRESALASIGAAVVFMALTIACAVMAVAGEPLVRWLAAR